MRQIIYGLPLLLALLSCSAPPPPALPDAEPSGMFADYLQWQADGQRVLRIAPADSLLTVTVRRGGPLARMGHDHVVAARQLQGYAAPAQGRAALRFRLDQMTVDEAALRQQAGLDTQPSDEAVAGTRRNMLGKVLDAERHPWVLVQIRRAPQAADWLLADITLHGVTRQYLVPASVRDDGRTLQAAGALRLKQSDFGITPYAVLGGALAVQDELELAFAVSAR